MGAEYNNQIMKRESIIKSVKYFMGFQTNEELCRYCGWEGPGSTDGMSITTVNHCTAPTSTDTFEKARLMKKLLKMLGCQFTIHDTPPKEDYLETADGKYIVFHFIPNYEQYVDRFLRMNPYGAPFKVYPK